jgi:hypothetical protein
MLRRIFGCKGEAVRGGWRKCIKRRFVICAVLEWSIGYMRWKIHVTLVKNETVTLFGNLNGRGHLEELSLKG